MEGQSHEIKIKRNPVILEENVYVRWDEYSGGDSAWRGGELEVVHNSLTAEASCPDEMQKEILTRCLKWCNQYLPGESVRLSPEKGWQINFEVSYQEGRRKYYTIRPLVTKEMGELIIKYAAERRSGAF